MNYTPEQTQEKRQKDIPTLCEHIIANNIDICKGIDENVYKLAHAFQSEPIYYKDYFVQIAQIKGLSESSAIKMWNRCEKKNNHKSNIKSFFHLCKEAGIDINTKTEESTEKTKASKVAPEWDKRSRLVLWILFKEPFKHTYYDKETGEQIENDRHTFYSKKLTELEPSVKDGINFFFYEKIEKLHKINPIKEARIYFNYNRGNSVPPFINKNSIVNNAELCRYKPDENYKYHLAIKQQAINNAETLPYLEINKYLSLKEIDKYFYELQAEEEGARPTLKKGSAQYIKNYILDTFQQAYTPNSQKFHAQRAENQHANNIFHSVTNVKVADDSPPQENKPSVTNVKVADEENIYDENEQKKRICDAILEYATTKEIYYQKMQKKFSFLDNEFIKDFAFVLYNSYTKNKVIYNNLRNGKIEVFFEKHFNNERKKKSDYLNECAWNMLLEIKKSKNTTPEQKTEIFNLLKYSIDLFENYYNLDTLAQFFYFIEHKEMAIFYMKKAIKKGKQENENVKASEKLLNKWS